MIKNIPSPCCGSYDVLLKSKIEGSKIWYSAHCPHCGLGTKSQYDSKQEAIYEYEDLCVQTWKREPDGLLEWMKKPIDEKDEEELQKRIQIKKDVQNYLLKRN